MKMTLRMVAAVAVAALAFGRAGAGVPVDTFATTGLGTSGDVGTTAVNFSHRDCVGPGLPGTTTPHSTHTQNVTGFVPGGGVVRFGLSLFSPFTAGICPTTLAGPVLSEDFTGTYRITAVCRGSNNAGAIFIDWEVEAIAGQVQAQGSDGTPCIGQVGSQFSLDVTIAISDTSLLGIPLDPIGGVKLTITQ